MREELSRINMQMTKTITRIWMLIALLLVATTGYAQKTIIQKSNKDYSLTSFDHGVGSGDHFKMSRCEITPIPYNTWNASLEVFHVFLK